MSGIILTMGLLLYYYIISPLLQANEEHAHSAIPHHMAGPGGGYQRCRHGKVQERLPLPSERDPHRRILPAGYRGGAAGGQSGGGGGEVENGEAGSLGRSRRCVRGVVSIQVCCKVWQYNEIMLSNADTLASNP